jgi:hypothetical protein
MANAWSTKGGYKIADFLPHKGTGDDSDVQPAEVGLSYAHALMSIMSAREKHDG